MRDNHLSPSRPLPSHEGRGVGGGVTILFIGDIVGKPGRKAVQALLPGLREEFKPDVVIANLENLAHGKGLTKSTVQEMIDAGIDIATGGNHTFTKPEAMALHEAEPNFFVRPQNWPEKVPGQGVKTFTVSGKTVTVINLLGEFGMAFPPVDSPFKAMEQIVQSGLPDADAIVVDIHAEATSEKVAMGWYLNGKVALVAGTHTHVPTADARVLPAGTAYITDIGMVGLRDSSLGVDKEGALKRFLTGEPGHFEVTDHGPVVLNAVLVHTAHGRAKDIALLQRTTTV